MINRASLSSLSSPEVNFSSDLSLAEASRIAYYKVNHRNVSRAAEQAAAFRREIIAESGFARAEFLIQGNAEAFVCSDDQLVVLSFRGTDKLNDWGKNLNAARAETPWGRVHTGFLESLQHVWDAILQEFSKQGASSKRLWITGHSLGGAMAVLAAARLRWEERSPQAFGVRTYGQPAVGWRDFASSCEGELGSLTCRYVNAGDAITTLPPAGKHFGQTRRFRRRGGVTAYELGLGVEPDALDVDEEEESMMSEAEAERFREEAAFLPDMEILEAEENFEAGAVNVLSRSGSLPAWVRSHSIHSYITNLKAMVAAGR